MDILEVYVSIYRFDVSFSDVILCVVLVVVAGKCGYFFVESIEIYRLKIIKYVNNVVLSYNIY